MRDYKSDMDHPIVQQILILKYVGRIVPKYQQLALVSWYIVSNQLTVRNQNLLINNISYPMDFTISL